MRFQIPCFRFVNIRLVAIFTLELLLTSCGGGNWTPTNSASTSPPLIQAIILGFHSGGIPANQPTAMVGVNDASTGSPITNATVTVNGVTLAYNAALGHEEYEGVVSINPGVTVTLVVQTGGKTYTSTATQITTYPVISTPVSGAAFLSGDANAFAWSSGAPLTSSATYSLIIADANDPVGVSPDISVYSTGVTRTSRIGITPGNKVVILGLSNMTTIASADPNSYMDVGGYSYVPVTVHSLVAPMNVQSTLGDGQVTLTWNQVANATSYNLYYSTIEPFANTQSGTKISGVSAPYTHTGLANGTRYYYVVTAVNANGEGFESAITFASPGATVDLSATAGNMQTTLSWPVVNGATSYALFWDSMAANLIGYNNVSTQIVGVSSPYVHTGLTNGGNYYYKVIAIYPDGWGPADSPVAKAIPGSTLMGGAVQGYPLSLLGNTSPVSTYANASAITTDGNTLYLTDTSNNTIHRLNTISGEMTTIAGSGSIGSANGIGVSASFNVPQGVTTDGNNLYVVDKGNSTIRKITIATGAVTTLAGTPGVVGTGNGIGSVASFDNPWGITTDGANLYVTETSNKDVRKIVIATGEVTTLASGGFTFPTGITTDGTNLYVADRDGNAIKKVVIATGVVTTLAGSGAGGAANGFGTSATFLNPGNVVTDGVNLYVTDNGDLIRKIAISTGEVTTPSMFIPYLQGVTTDGVNLIAVSASFGIYKIF